MTLYNCKHAGDEYRITKFDHNLEVESSYLCNVSECNCPAGVRPTCRHRQMLPKFIQRKAIDSNWMYDFDRGGWVQIALSEGGLDSGEADLGSILDDLATPADGLPAPNITATEINERIGSMLGPENAIVEPLVDRIVEILQDHGLAKPTFRRRL